MTDIRRWVGEALVLVLLFVLCVMMIAMGGCVNVDKRLVFQPTISSEAAAELAAVHASGTPEAASLDEPATVRLRGGQVTSNSEGATTIRALFAVVGDWDSATESDAVARLTGANVAATGQGAASTTTSADGGQSAGDGSGGDATDDESEAEPGGGE